MRRWLPAGVYVGATLTLDNADALLVVDSGNGGTVQRSNIFNALADTALTGENSQITLQVKLPAGKPSVVTGGTVAHLSLDFDLAAATRREMETVTATAMAMDTASTMAVTTTAGASNSIALSW